MQHSSLALHSEIKEQITYGLLNCSTIVQQKPDYIRIIHPLCGITLIELFKVNQPDLAIRLLVIPEKRWMNLAVSSRSSTEHFTISQWLSVTVFDFQRYCLRHQRISISVKLLATWSKALNSNQRTKPECRAGFDRKVLNTVWAESFNNRCLGNWQQNKRIYEL